jgi:adenine C2-methylase RlmN of 23S rRNA A2503 and tRNA A37
MQEKHKLKLLELNRKYKLWAALKKARSIRNVSNKANVDNIISKYRLASNLMDKQMTASEINKILSGRPFHYK